MNPPVVEPASPVVAPREDPSTVEAPPAVPLAANPADAGDRATAAGRLATAPPGSASSAPRPAPASASPAVSAASRTDPGAPGEATASPASGRPSTADVIVVDDDAAFTAPEPDSAGRVSARLRAKQAARVVRAAARKVKRVGPASGASPKRRKSSTAAAPSSEAGAPASATCTPRPSARADFPSALVAGVDSAGIAPTSPPSPTPSAPVYSGGPPALTSVPPPALGRSDPPSSPSLMVTGEVAAPAPDTAPGHDVDAPLSAVASARVPGTVEPLRPSDYPEFAVMGSDLMPGSSQAASAAFNLAAFARAYTPEPVTADPPTVTQRLSLAAKVDQLFEMFTELRRELQSRAEDVPPHVGPSTDRGFPSQSSTRPSGVPAGASPAPPGSWTLPPSGNSADMPPAAVSELRCDSFQLPRTRVKGEYYPPLAHQLAAHRLFRDLSSETGRWLSPMSFVLHLRELECVRFDAPPAVLMALYSGRLGSRGLTVMHFRPQSEMEQLERGSSNANFSADFGAGATLPATTVDCPTYEDLLAAIGGLISFGDALWYDHARRLLSRVKRFVLANLERDHNTHERVMLTVMFVNQFIGRALAHLLVDSPHWWRNFNEAVRAVDYHSPDWQAALNGLALRMASTPARASNGSQPVQPPRPGGAPSRRGPAARTPIMPERIRRLIPRDRDGREPCLRFMGGGMCYGGSAERCAHQQRTHRWDGRLPRELQEFIDRTYRSGPRQSASAKAPHGPCAPTASPPGTPLGPEPPYGAPPATTQPPPATDVRSAPLRLARAPLRTSLHGRTRPGAPSGSTAAPTDGDVHPLAGQPLVCGCRVPEGATRHRAAPSPGDLERLTSDSHARASLWEDIRLRTISSALGHVGLTLPSVPPTVINSTPVLNKDLQRVLSEFVRRTQISLPRFVELMRGQTPDDYRPNKRMLPDVIRTACRGYQHLDALLAIADSGVRAPVSEGMPHQHVYPTNHKSAADRYPVLIKNIRKEQDLWRCFVLDLDILGIWPEVRISPFGVVDKGDADPLTSGRVIHDLSFPEGASINDATDATSICTPVFEPCDAIAVEILRQRRHHPDVEIQLQAGDVASAFRNVCTHSQSAYLFGGRLLPDNALVIDTSAAFGWSGSPASYGIIGGAIAHIHGSSINSLRPPGPFNYYWVDDHINVAADIGSNCADVERSLRGAMVTVLGHGAINEAKFTPWCPRQKALGLIFDSQAGTVAMPASKIRVAQTVVAAALERTSLRRSDYRSLLGRLRHVATCVRPARPFLQRLCQQERHLRRWQHVPVTEDMRADLRWWLSILRSPALNGVPLAYFGSCPEPDVVVEMDASDLAICTFVAADKLVLRYFFTPEERRLIHASKSDPSVGFDINYRELLSCAFAVHAWGQQWSSRRASTHGPPVHVRFKIDNMSAVAWQNKMASRNHRAQTIIRLLGHWELVFGLRFSAMHVAGADNRIADAGSRSSAATSGCSESRSDLAFHLRAHSVANSTFSKYRSALKTWFAWSTSRGIQPTLFGYTTDAKIQCITDFILHGFQHGYGSGRPVRGATISAVLHGVLHFFRSAALDFPSGHPQIRMLLKGISRLDAPVRHKAPVSLQLLERCYRTLDLAMPSDQALWGVLCLSFFFLLRQSEIASKGKKFAWFALRAVDIAIFNSAGATTHIAHEATSVHIRLTGSKTNQRGAPTLRMLNRSGHPFLCPVFGALCLLKPRRALPHEIPAAVFINEKGRPDCVTSARVSDILQRVAPSVGGNPAEFSAHSLRAGGATHMYRAGVDALTIQFHGRWASDTFKQYTRLCKESVETLATKIVSGQKRMQRLQ